MKIEPTAMTVLDLTMRRRIIPGFNNPWGIGRTTTAVDITSMNSTGVILLGIHKR